MEIYLSYAKDGGNIVGSLYNSSNYLNPLTYTQYLQEPGQTKHGELLMLEQE